MNITYRNGYSPTYSSIIRQIPKHKDHESFWEALTEHIVNKTELSVHEFAALYHGTAVVLKALEGQNNKKEATEAESLLLDLYYSLVIESDGEEFAAGSDEYTVEDYEMYSQAIANELIEMKAIAELYVENIENFEPILFVTNKNELPARFQRVL
ncbi:hypothetical protein [Alkalihalobacterium bogoriense]|uniref:hypothetical protein n=1 Tax=Alkalihalobacterium bogoriense TaxID=246272 RepID=UPI000478BFAC|nr:hypothetical protein [Alkalihalobacterium bogoriense]